MKIFINADDFKEIALKTKDGIHFYFTDSIGFKHLTEEDSNN